MIQCISYNLTPTTYHSKKKQTPKEFAFFVPTIKKVIRITNLRVR
jgi:hypothetical protein